MSAPVGAEGVTRGHVLAYLSREADLDGLVTVSETEVAQALGIAQVTAHYHFDSLRDAGLLTQVGRVARTSRGGRVVAYQLSEGQR